MHKFAIIFQMLLVNLKSIFTKIKNRISYFCNVYIKKEEFFIAHKKWVSDKGDSTLRLEYPLNSESIVFDVGGYKGDFAEAINSRYDCYVYVFEPVKCFFEICKTRFANNPKIKCFNFALSDLDGELFISNEDNSSSILKNNIDEMLEKVQVRQFSSVLNELIIKKIDLLKLNIEGGEYLILPHLIQLGLAQNIRYLQIQFHNFIPNAIEMRKHIREQLSITHNESWNYTFIWESWECK